MRRPASWTTVARIPGDIQGLPIPLSARPVEVAVPEPTDVAAIAHDPSQRKSAEGVNQFWSSRRQKSNPWRHNGALV
jgi:hypothetical protein